jgi:hypothetical protein
MGTAKTVIKIKNDFDEKTLQLIGEDIVNFIIDRTRKKGLDKNNDPLPAPYSNDYAKSLDFKIAGKSKNKVDLTLTGEMLDLLNVINVSSDKIEIGYEEDDEFIGKVEGNIKGSYGGSPRKSLARDFLGIHEDDLKKILKRYVSRSEKKEIEENYSSIVSQYKRSRFEYDDEDEE